MGEKMGTSVCIRLPDDTARELDNIANTVDRTRSYLIKKAIDTYLHEYADYMIAFERLHDKDDEIISGKEMRERLGL
ncbi:MAG: ribbon-helix-helix protein, CopG family [Candidatus Thermoplasmatota archaeon]|jgi:RHH-type rel operon transcriptional repressor/antitoxin RelB|nr:ribbon-helix-helix protein, CopG family [Candidatus Thermoplasmatota archaeon]